MCDNCLVEADEQVDLTIPAQKFLSCVVRTGEIFGINHIVDVLRGSRARRVLELRHDKLSTYGIGMEYSAEQWKLLAGQFIRQLLLRRDMEHGSIQLTPNGWAVFKGEPVWGTPVETQVSRHSASDETAEYDIGLFEQLRAKRKALADAEGIPPYMVFSDRSLHEMATYFPLSREAFESIHGVGPVKVERYGGSFLAIIRDYCQQHGQTEQAKLTSRPSRPTTDSSIDSFVEQK